MNSATHKLTAYTLAPILAVFALLSNDEVNAKGRRACTIIESVPYTISLPGNYCLVGDVVADPTDPTVPAIRIDANDVVINLKGHNLSESPQIADSSRRGIAGLARRNVTIRNGTVSGFGVAIELFDGVPYKNSRGNIVEKVRAVLNRINGIHVSGTANIVRNNIVDQTALSPVNFAVHVGIIIQGPNNLVSNNVISDIGIPGKTNTRGINLQQASGTIVRNNHIGNDFLEPKIRHGIIVSGGRALLIDNQITRATNGIICTTNVVCKYRDNITSDVDVPYTGGVDIGNNN